MLLRETFYHSLFFTVVKKYDKGVVVQILACLGPSTMLQRDGNGTL